MTMGAAPDASRSAFVGLSVSMLAGILAAAAPALAWVHQNPGSPAFGGAARDVVLDGAGDVVTAGYVFTGSGQQDLAVIKLEGDTGTQIWRTEMSGTGSGADSAWAVGLDGAGDVFAGGRLHDTVTRSDFSVVKLDGATGAELWRTEIDGAHAGSEDADGVEALAVDGAGDVVAVGRIFDTSFSDFFVIKLDGETGAEVWSRRIDGALGVSRDVARAVALDSDGDVVVAGHIWSPGSGFAVVKLDGTDGTELWRQGLSKPGSVASNETASAIVVDGAGDVVVAGRRRADTSLEFAVFKLDGASGAELWGHLIDGGHSRDERASAVTVDADGDVVAAGMLFSAAKNWDFTVVKFDGDTGAESWRRAFDGTLDSPHIEDLDEATVVVTDDSSDVFALGVVDNDGTRWTLAAVKLEAGSGSTLWRHESAGLPISVDQPFAAAVDARADLVAASGLEGAMTVFRLDGRRGSLRAIAGSSLVVKDPGDPAKRSLRAVLKSEHVVSPEPGSFADPRTAGATVRIVNPTTLEEATFALPAGPEWAGLGSPPGSTGYTYRAVTSPGPCTFAQVRGGKRIRVQCSARFGPIPFTLDESAQGSLAASLQLGHSSAQCSVFGGTVKTDAPGKFQAKSAPEQLNCP